MCKFPYMKLYVADFIADTEGLSGAQSWAYMGILMGLWRNRGKLPLNDEVLRRLARCDGKNWRRTWEAIKHFFIIKDGEISQGRLSAEIDKADAEVEARRARSAPGAQGRALNGSKPLKNNNLTLVTSEPVPIEGKSPIGFSPSIGRAGAHARLKARASGRANPEPDPCAWPVPPEGFRYESTRPQDIAHNLAIERCLAARAKAKAEVA